MGLMPGSREIEKEKTRTSEIKHVRRDAAPAWVAMGLRWGSRQIRK